MKVKFDLKSALMLFAGAILWGLSFVFQSKGLVYVSTFVFSFLRSILGFLFSFMLAAILPDDGKKERTKDETLKGGLCAGLVLFFAMNLQQLGLSYTIAGKAGFITALYIVIVPILGLFLGKRVEPKVWCCLLISLFGFYLISIKGKVDIEKGDLIVFSSSILFAVHILVLSRFSPNANGIKLNGIQFLVAGVLSGIVALATETIDISAIMDAKWSVLYVGIFSSGLAFALQILGLKKMDPTLGTMISSLESVVALIGGVIILKESLSSQEALGCAFVFISTIIAQIPIEEILYKRKERTA